MNSEKIYPHFKKKIESKTKDLMKNIVSSQSELEKKKIHRIILSFRDIPTRDEYISKNAGIDVIQKFDVVPAVSLLLTKEQIYNIQSDKFIERIEEDQALYLSILEINKIIKLNKYRKSQYVSTGNKVTIGIIDNGINQAYDSIWDVVINSYKISNNQKIKNRVKNNEEKATHGTLMASIIGNQYLNHDDNLIGIAPNARLIDLNVSNDSDLFCISNILEMFDIIIKRAEKINILLISFTTLDPSDGNDILCIACNVMVDKGFIVVCPAGNFGPESYTIGSPSAAEKVITIGTLTKELTMAYYSGRGPTLDKRLKPDFCLPGSKVNIPLSNNVNIDFSGTSVSAAIGASLIALLKEYHPKITHKRIMDILRETCSKLEYEDISQGFGTFDVLSLFKQLNLYQKKVLPYKYLSKRALKFSIEIISVLLVVFFIFFYFNSI